MVVELEDVVVVRSPVGVTLVFNDALFNMPHGGGFSGFVFRHLTRSTGGPRMSRVFRWLVVKDRPAFAVHLERLADILDLVRIIVSHHRMITETPSDTLRGVAETLR